MFLFPRSSAEKIHKHHNACKHGNSKSNQGARTLQQMKNTLLTTKMLFIANDVQQTRDKFRGADLTRAEGGEKERQHAGERWEEERLLYKTPVFFRVEGGSGRKYFSLQNRNKQWGVSYEWQLLRAGAVVGARGLSTKTIVAGTFLPPVRPAFCSVLE